MWRYLKSAAGALFGVQSETTRQNDFQQSSILPFVIAGIVLIGTFIVGLLLIVRWVLAMS